MSRTHGHKGKNNKGGGYEYWSRRPGPRDPGKENKKITHKIERQKERELIHEETIKGF